MKISIKIKRKNMWPDFFLTGYLFFFLFAPPILPVLNINIQQAVLSFLYIILHYSKSRVMKCSKECNMQRFLIHFLTIVFYMLVTSIISLLVKPVNFSNYLNTYYGIFLVTVILMINILFILLYCRKWNYSLIQLIRCCIFAGTLQAVIAVMMLVNKPLRQYLLNVMYLNTGNQYLVNTWFTSFRVYGFSNCTYDIFGYGVGILAGIAFYMGMNYKKRYFIPLVLLVILTFLNSRTGLVITLVGISLCMLMNLRYVPVKMGKIVFLVILAVLCGGFIYDVLQKYSASTIQWVMADMIGLEQTLKGKQIDSGSLKLLFSQRFWTLPDAGGLLFGTGHTIYGAEGFVHSDVGYINLIWHIGLIGMCGMLITFADAFRRAYFSGKDKMTRWLAVFLGISYFVFNIKGMNLTYQPGLAITLLLTFSICYLQDSPLPVSAGVENTEKVR